MIKVNDILKIVDIDKKAVNIETWNFLNEYFIAYKDQVLKEHLIDMTGAIEEVTNEDPEHLPQNKFAKKIISEVAELWTLCVKHEAGYVRFIE